MNAADPFARLAPFIQSYIYQQQWDDLRAIQKQAIPAILDTNAHVVIMSGTASGKTEAALLPILTLLDQSPPQSVGVIYIGPLKALINDQFDRVQRIVQEHPDIPIQGWHGDIAHSQKQRFLKHPRGIVQITPESLESLLINHAGDIPCLFGDLRFIVIDEIHAFLGSDRGQQVLCQIQRIERAIRQPVRRLGLSATIGDPALALEWIASGSPVKAMLVRDEAAGRRVEMRLNHFVMALEAAPFNATMAPDGLGRKRQATQPGYDATTPVPASTEAHLTLQRETSDYYDDLFAMTRRGHKTLVFVNQRANAERIAAEMRQRQNAREPGRDSYFVHHGSIAADLRQNAEAMMRDASQPSCTVATSTLELGIDIGALDLVVQIGAPFTVSSLVQRLGRSGRRGTTSRMCFYLLEQPGDQHTAPLEAMPWNFVQTVAMLQLYLEEQWIEPPALPSLPVSLLYQQTMSEMRARTEMTPQRLAQAVLSLAPFQSVTLDDYRLFLQHLIATDHLAQMDEGSLIVGMKGERLTGHYHFYAIFQNERGWRVVAGMQEIGEVESPPEVESVIGLAGYAWRVISVDEHRRTLFVERARGVVQPKWNRFGALNLHARVLQRMRQVLQEEAAYPYLSPLAQQRLQMARSLALQSGWLDGAIVPLAPGRFALFPWTHARVCDTIAAMLKHHNWHVEDHSPFYLIVVHAGSAADVRADLRVFGQRELDAVALIADLDDIALRRGKYDHLAPRALLEKAYAWDVLDVAGASHWLAECV